MSQIEIFIKNTQKFFYQNPQYFELLLVGLGIFLLIGVLKDWNWVMEKGEGLFDPTKIANRIGRKAARIWMASLAFLCIFIGLVYFFVY